MTWSAGNTAMTAVVERAPARAAPSVTAAQVSRPHGSLRMFCLGSFGSCCFTPAACAAFVMIKMLLSGTSGRTRSTACCSNDRLSSKFRSCLGLACRLIGQKRSPRPPAMMITKRSLMFGLIFMGYVLTASSRVFTKAVTRGTSSGLCPCRLIWSTTALPTTIATACPATRRACSGLEMPKPTAMGRSVC